MPWNLEITFSGLCVFLPHGRPDGWKYPNEPYSKFRGALLVDSDYSSHRYPHTHPHRPLLSFDIADVDDYPGDLDSLRPGFELSTGLDGQQVGTYNLAGYELSLESDELKNHPLKVVEGRAQGRKPANDFETADFKWVVDLKELGVTDFTPSVWGQLDANNPVTTRIRFDNGELASKRVNLDRKGDPNLWEFYPRSQGLIQSLSDQAVLSFRNLTRAFRIRLNNTNKKDKRFVFFAGGGRTVRVGISNLPVMTELPDEVPLTHFRAFYNLFTDNHGPIPESKRYAPVLCLEDALRGVSGGSVFCPDTKV